MQTKILKYLGRVATGTMILLCVSCTSGNKDSLVSPNGKVRFSLESTEDGWLSYSISLDGKQMVEPSRLGIVRNGREIGQGLRVASKSETAVDDEYSLKGGKRRSTRDHCNEAVFGCTTTEGEKIDLIVRVYDDGAAFRYRINAPAEKNDTINSELTEFHVPADGRAWIHPYDWNNRHKPSYEQYSKNNIAVNSLPDHDRGWAFPMLFQSADSAWMMITEAYLDGSYPATHVDNSGTDGCYRIRFPEADEPVIDDEPLAIAKGTHYTPWRAVIVGNDLNDVFSSQMVSHLNPPCVLSDTTWIRPGRAAWSWWSNGRSASDYATQLRYVDLCKELGWEYSLIDAGWEKMDGDGVEGVVEYAKDKGVGIWLWYHSGSGKDSSSPAQHRLMSDSTLRRAEMKRISDMGVKGIKVDFFDTDKQRIIALYPEILKDAANYHLLVDFHGATLPRGLERTYPNLMTTEAIRGGETLGRQERCERAAEHNATVPFTRNVVGSMDYTPVTFSDKIRQGVAAHRRTSMAHQLALSVVFESAFQCFADCAESYLGLPDAPKEFLKSVPATWDESILLAGYPSEYAVVGRRSGDTWYIGGINGTNMPRSVSFNLPEGVDVKSISVIGDGNDIDSFENRSVKVENGVVTVDMLGNGGFAAKLN